MLSEALTIEIDPAGELAHALDAATASVILVHEGVRYRVIREDDADDLDNATSAPTAASAEDDPILRIIGIGRSTEPSDIARFKDQYIADAILHNNR